MSNNGAIIKRIRTARSPIYELIIDDEIARLDVGLQRPDSAGRERGVLMGRATTRGAGTVVELIGNTPRIRLTHVTAHLPEAVTVAAKAEMNNPGGSVKDRPARAMIEDGIARGLLTPDKTIPDATSGNTCIAHAMSTATLGYRSEL